MSKKIAMIFPGQGSQSVGMGKSFYENSPLAREMFEKAGERIGVDFAKLLFEPNEQLDQTAYTQPAILLVSLIAYRLFQEARPSDAVMFLGHSLGEFSALAAAGAIDYVDAVELVHKRGALMQSACESIDAGMMAILGLDDAVVEELCAKAQDEGKKSMARQLQSGRTAGCRRSQSRPAVDGKRFQRSGSQTGFTPEHVDCQPLSAA